MSARSGSSSARTRKRSTWSTFGTRGGQAEAPFHSNPRMRTHPNRFGRHTRLPPGRKQRRKKHFPLLRFLAPLFSSAWLETSLKGGINYHQGDIIVADVPRFTQGMHAPGELFLCFQSQQIVPGRPVFLHPPQK